MRHAVRSAGVAALLLLAATAGARADPWMPEPMPAPVAGEAVTFPSHSPFTLRDVGAGLRRDPPTEAVGRLFLPSGASRAEPVPAVVLLHGASGVIPAREPAYGAELAAKGIAALVVDVFGSRGRHGGFVERLLNITEAMYLADAYAALRWLDARPEIDGSRVALVGFSYGGMASHYAVYRIVAERYAPDGRRFVGHVAYYGPCIARFADYRTTGAPVLMLIGGSDAITDRGRCLKDIERLRAGGSDADLIVYEGAHHQWDGRFAGPYRIGRNLAPCRILVQRNGTVRESFSWLPMVDPFTRRLILGLCSDAEGYMVGRDDAVRARSNEALDAFLEDVFDLRAPRG